MGQGFSQDNGIWVQTDKPSYYEGEVLFIMLSSYGCGGNTIFLLDSLLFKTFATNGGSGSGLFFFFCFSSWFNSVTDA